MQHGLMANGTAPANSQWRTHIRVQHAAILNVAAFPHRDQLVVAAQDSVEPDAGISRQPHAANDIGAGRNPIGPRLRQFGSKAVKDMNCHRGFPFR